MRISELEKKLQELKNKYQDKIIQTEEGIVHIYYTFKAGQVGWAKHFDRWNQSARNFEEAAEHILSNYGYVGRDSELIAYKNAYIEGETEENIFEY